jgi:hypothetical protein
LSFQVFKKTKFLKQQILATFLFYEHNFLLILLFSFLVVVVFFFKKTKTKQKKFTKDYLFNKIFFI